MKTHMPPPTPNLSNMVCYCPHCRAGFWRGLFTSMIWIVDGVTPVEAPAGFPEIFAL